MTRTVWQWTLAVGLAAAATASAGAARSVKIIVQDAAGAPVTNARVLIAADEMDAVGTTDAAGSVQVKTTSATLEVRVEKDGKRAAATSPAETITVRLPGAAK